MMDKAIGPARDRIDLLDALRGFALLGILFANIQDWSGWLALTEEERISIAGDVAAQSYRGIMTALVEGKFYTIFSFLFGLGFALQLSRLEQRGAPGAAIYRRRLLVLLAIGIVHLVLVWEGDILTLYALLGLLLPFLRRWSDRSLLIAAAVLILLPLPGFALVHAVDLDPDLRLKELGYWIWDRLGGDTEQEKMWRAREDWGSFLTWTLSGWPFRLGGLIESWRIPKVLAIMMLGLWAGRRLVAGDLLTDRRRLKRIAVIGFAVGLPANIAYAAIGGLEQDDVSSGFAASAAYAVGVVPLGLAYAASFALLWPRGQRLLAILAAPGRMALTNYLSHSLLCIALFYGVGFGLFATLTPIGICAIALAIFALQILWSHLWLRRFDQGPMEAVWRRLTYRRAGGHDGMRPAR
jgi:uncharacterized protein